MTATQAPTPGPLSGDDVKLLVKGDLLRVISAEVMPIGSVVTFTESDFDETELRFDEGDGLSWFYDRFAFIGRPDADGWMPWSGGENPVPGQRVDAEGSRFVGKLRDTPSDQVRWDRVARFRLAPTAPVEASGSEQRPFEPIEHPLYTVSEPARRQLIRAASWIEKEAYDASGDDAPEDEGLDEAARFLRDIFDLSDDALKIVRNGSDEIVSIGCVRPQTSGETREAVGNIARLAEELEQNHKEKRDTTIDCWTAENMANDLRALLSARPLALGGQQGEEIDEEDDDDDPHSPCSVCGDEHPDGVLEDGCCPSCCDEEEED